MKKMKIALGILGIGVLCVAAGSYWSAGASRPAISDRFDGFGDVPAAEQSGAYGFDKAHSYIGFKIRHMGLVDVPGAFKDFEGEVDFNSEKIGESSVKFTAKVESVDTRVNGRDNHLRSPDFFEVATYPDMTFASKKVVKAGDKMTLVGDLTIKDVTKEVEIPFRIYGPVADNRGTVRMGIVGTAEINRREFKVNYGGNLPDGTPVIADTVSVDLQIEAVKKKEADQ